MFFTMEYLIFIVLVIGLASAGALPSMKPPTDTRNPNNNNQGGNYFSPKQQAVLELLTNLQHDNPYKKHAQEKEDFNPFRNGNKFNNHEAVLRFLRNYNKNGFIPQDEVFSPSNQEHQNQAAQLFNFFYSARDWNTLHQTAAWARDRFNPEQFAYSFIAAVLNHPETRGIVVIPALYEVSPHSFIPATALQKIYNSKFQGHQHSTVYANYTNQNLNNNFYNNANSNNNENENPHNPNSVFAENNGAPYNNAGTPENPENRVSYFTEDVGINAFHAGYHAKNPSFYGSNFDNNYWISNKNNIDNNDETKNGKTHNNYDNQEDLQRGEEFYYVHQQLYARYVLERLSNNLPIPKPINFNSAVKPGYNPNLQYANGQAVPARPPNAQFQQLNNNDNNNVVNAQQPNNDQAQNPVVYEQRLQEAAESGYVLNEDGLKTKLTSRNGIAVLANLAAAPGRSPNPAYYGNYFSTASYAIGNIVDPNNQNGVAPGAASNYATAARDPAYYKFLAKFLQIFYNFQNNQGPYSQSQLAFDGVKIDSFDVSRLVTYFESFNVNVNNAVNVDPNSSSNKKNNNNDSNQNSNEDYTVKFQRLNNQPFNYKLVVQSSRNTKAVVRVFIGPQYDSNGQEFTLPQASQYFVQLDQFTVKLDAGKNKIQRNSQQSSNFDQDPPSFNQIWNKIQNSIGQQSSKVNNGENNNWRIPQRMQLPKGSVEGQQFIFYAIVTEAEAINGNTVADNKMFEIKNINENNDNGINGIHTNDYDCSDDEAGERNHDYDDDNNNTNNNEDYDDRNKNVHKKNLDSNNGYYINNNYNNRNQDSKSIGYPFDRPVQDINYNTPNQIFKSVTIFHKINKQAN